MIRTVSEIKQNQETLEKKILEMSGRLLSVEAKTAAFEKFEEELKLNQELIRSAKRENADLRARFDDYEEHSRRDNLLFYSVSDSTSENWRMTEEKILGLFTVALDFPVTSNDIARAHRLGSFIGGKCRPIIVKFSSFKVKERFLFSCSKLKDNGIGVREDFSIATRHARKKLINFGKGQDSVFQLQYNRLYMGKKCYVYNAVSDSVVDLEGPSTSQHIEHIYHI